MDHYMEPLSSQAIVDEDNQEAVINANVAELESQYEYDNNEPLTATPVKANNNNILPTQPSAPKKAKENLTSTGTCGGKQPASSKRKLQFTTDDVVEEEDEQPSSLDKNT